MASAGLRDLVCLAVLPDVATPRTVIPLEPPCPPSAETFALNQAWKRATPGRALGRRALRLFVRLRLMRQVYPYYVVAGRMPC
jgi:hypothetical protein